MRLILPLLIALTFSIGISTNFAFAELEENNAYVIEGSGFAVTEQEIKNSQIDFALTTGNIANGRGGISIDDGFITLNNDDFIVDSISGTILRDGKFLRISGTAEDSSNDGIGIRIFGRLIEDSDDGSIYSFTGRIEHGNTEYKILYTSKVSGFDGILTTPSQTQTSSMPAKNTIRILDGASTKGAGSYIGTLGSAGYVAGYFSLDRLSVEPGTTVTFINDDKVSHRIVSGTGLGTHSSTLGGKVILCAEEGTKLPKGFSYTQSNCDFTFDGRINSGEILPGASVDITFNDIGFYRLIDPDYPWMTITAYSFNDVGSLIINQGKNQLGN